MADTIQKLTIEGFKSIRKLEDFPLGPLNVLIGPNGAGKSNFVSFFRVLRELVPATIADRDCRRRRCGHFSISRPKETQRLGAKFSFGRNGYEFCLVPTSEGRLIFSEESTVFHGDSGAWHTSFGTGHAEARIMDRQIDPGTRAASKDVTRHVFEAISTWLVFHFHDTSPSAGVRRPRALNDNEALRPEADNLAAFLFRIQHTSPDSYSQIRDVVRLAAPFFDDFHLRPMPTSPDMIQLEWRQRGSDYPFRSNQFSDGTLRFICLATALLQPVRPPTILFDEPELGLHPYALTLLGNLFKKCATSHGNHVSHQIIVSTQSAPLLNELDPEDIIIVKRRNGESTFRRLESSTLSEWLKDYTLGELWQKNVLGGRPREDRVEESVSG